MAKAHLTNAKNAKNDEFYTQYSDVQKEIEAYLEYDADTFKGKAVYCNCDDPFESNFFKYFVLNFNRLGLKRLITTSYKPSPIANTQLALIGEDKIIEPAKGRPKPTANKFVINDVGDTNGDGAFGLPDIAKQLQENKNNEWAPLEGDGDFRSAECIELLKQSDVVVTNPPFSLFREYVAQLIQYNKKFAIIGNMNAITYKEIFPLIKENRMWLGVTRQGTGSMWFQVTKDTPVKTGQRIDENGVRYQTIGNSAWFTNLDHGHRHQALSLMTESDIVKFGTKKPFDRYDNYDAIEVPLVKYIPSDFTGNMGVPITFLGKYNPEQFEIIGMAQRDCHNDLPDTRKYDDYVQMKGDGSVEGSNGRKIDEAPVVTGRVEGKTFYRSSQGRDVTSLYMRIFIRHKKGASS